MDVTITLSSIAIALVLTCCSPPSSIQQQHKPEYWPTDGWKSASPESQGVDSEKLIEMLAHIQDVDPGIHSLLIIRHGYIILDAAFFPYDGTTPHDTASVTKSVISTLLGAAIEASVLNFLDQRVGETLDIAPSLLDNSGKANITLKNLVTMRSGVHCGRSPGEFELRRMMSSSDWIDFTFNLPLSDPPGSQFAYCSPGFHLLSAVISKASGQTAHEFATRTIFKPLGIIRSEWPTDPSGYNHGWRDLRLSPRDIAKIGYLYLHYCQCNTRRILPEDWIEEATRSRGTTETGYDGYGLGWWLPSDEFKSIYEARGRGGQRIIVAPDIDLIVVTTGTGFDPRSIAPFLKAAIKADDPLLENPVASKKLSTALVRARRGPKPVRTSPMPPVGAIVSGVTYRMGPNILGIDAVRFDFSPEALPSIRLEFSSALSASLAGRYDLSIGIDGRYRIT